MKRPPIRQFGAMAPVLCLLLTGCGAFWKPGTPLADVPQNIRRVAHILDCVHKRDANIASMRIKADMLIEGHIQDQADMLIDDEENEGRPGKSANLGTWVLLKGQDRLRISAHKRVVLTKLKIFDLWITGDSYTLANHHKRTLQTGSATAVQQDSPDLAMLPPDLGGTRLLYPRLTIEKDETAVLRRGKKNFRIMVYRKSGAARIPARRFYYDVKTLLIKKVQIFQPNGRLLASVAYNHYDWATFVPPADPESGETPKPVKVAFPYQIKVALKRKVKLLLNVDDVTINWKRIDARLRVAAYPNYDLKKPKAVQVEGRPDSNGAGNPAPDS